MTIIILLVVALFFIYVYISANGKDSQNHHDAARRKATKKVMANEKNIERGSISSPGPAVRPRKTTTGKRGKKRGGLINNLELEITYEDSKGDLTVRNISVSSYSESTGKVLAWCYLRNDQRSFFTDRMIEAIDTSTGESIEDIDAYLIEAVKR